MKDTTTKPNRNTSLPEDAEAGTPEQPVTPADAADNDASSNCAASESTQSSTVNTEDNLELHHMKFSERQRIKRQRLRENMEGMSKSQKFGYVFSYYRGKIILGIILLAICIALPVTIYKKSRPVALSYCIVNAQDSAAVNTGFVDDYLDFYELHGAYQIHKDTTVHLDKDTYLEEYAQNSSASVYTELPMLCFNGYYDIMIMDEKGLEYCAMQEIIYPLRNYLPSDIYAAVEDRIVTAADNDGIVVPFAIDISDTDFAKSLNLGYDSVYFGFPGNSKQNYVNAKRMLKYILHLDIETETTF